MMFGIALVPIMIAAGVGLDYARAALTKSQMGDALDAAALAVGSNQGLTSGQAQTLAQTYFNANYNGDMSGASKCPNGSACIPVTASYNSTGTVTLNITNYKMNTAVLKAVGIQNVGISASSTVVWGQSKLWVSLVLDNSGSMSASGKMTSLKSAAKQLLTTLQDAATNDGDVEVAIVPFTNEVNVGSIVTNSSAYLDWSNWNTQQDADTPDTTYGNGDGCPYSYGCRVPGAMTQASSSWTIATSGTYKGYVCPWSTSSSSNYGGTNSHYYMGCFTTGTTSSTTTVDSGKNATCGTRSSSNCSCTGSMSSSSRKCTGKVWTHPSWVAETDKTLWKTALSTSSSAFKYCITDRNKNSSDLDTLNTQPSGNSTGFTADNNDSCPDAPIMTLGYQWSSMSGAIDSMQPNGSTNQAIGLAHGWQMLTPGAPYGTPSLPAGTSRFIILLSDGLNTQDRWYGNGMTEGNSYDASIDARMATTCTNAKKDGVIIYTLFLNTNSTDDSAPLMNCATDTSKYFKVTASADLAAAFATIGQQITSVRVSK